MNRGGVFLTDGSTTTDGDLFEPQEGHGHGDDVGGDITDHLNRRGVLGDKLLRHGEGASRNMGGKGSVVMNRSRYWKLRRKDEVVSNSRVAKEEQNSRGWENGAGGA